jgi:prolyl-tRNA editing enzyme YbaK/EbsC (Cys-tRNA(Pro) deacylase)
MCKFNKIKHKNVITWTEAVIERKISLKQELKTLLLDVNSRIIAVQIRGSDRLKIRNIKKIFKTKNIFFV